MERVKRLDVYLHTQDARITYQERVRKALQTQDQVPAIMEPIVEAEDETATPGTPSAHILLVAENNAVYVTKDQGILPNDLEDKDHDPMGPSVLDNMEISMFHILSAEFQPTTS